MNGDYMKMKKMVLFFTAAIFMHSGVCADTIDQETFSAFSPAKRQATIEERSEFLKLKKIELELKKIDHKSSLMDLELQEKIYETGLIHKDLRIGTRSLVGTIKDNIIGIPEEPWKKNQVNASQSHNASVLIKSFNDLDIYDPIEGSVKGLLLLSDVVGSVIFPKSFVNDIERFFFL